MFTTIKSWLVCLAAFLLPLVAQSQCVTSNVFSDDGIQYVQINSDDDQQSFNLFNDIETASADYIYAVTGSDFNIIRFLTPDTTDGDDLNDSVVDVSTWEADKYFVWGFSYTGDVNLNAGDLVFTGSFSTGCFQISNTALVVEKSSGAVDGGEPTIVERLFASSNTQSVAGVFNILNNGMVTSQSFAVEAADADGIHYDEDNDVLYQLNRADNVINAYSNVVANLNNGMMPELTATSTSDFSNGREIAVSGSRLVVAQDATDANDGNKFIVYNISPTAITLTNSYPTGINLWGIHATGETLFAIVDNSDQLAIFNDFFANADGMVSPSQNIAVEGIVRTHGLTYISDRDMMIMTDVGAGSSPDDGAFVVIRGFSDAIFDGVVSTDEQIRIVGDNTFLGNPVDVAYAMANDMIYIAERANGGGRILGFTLPAMGSMGGNIAPDYNMEFAGASAVTLGNEEDEAESFTGGVDECINAVEGGTVALPDGNTEINIPYAGDGVADVVMVDSMGTNATANYTYIVTDGNGMILGIPPGDMANVDGAGGGNCRIYGLSYTGNLTATAGQDITTAMLSDACFDVSDNWVTTVRSAANIADRFFVSSNTTGQIGFYNIMADGMLTNGTFAAAAMDADGIHYDEDNDVLYQLNRTDNVINAYSNVVNNLTAGMMPELTATSTADFSNGREITVSGNRLVVAQDATDANDGNRFYVYEISPTAITLVNQYDAAINLWGIHATAETLYAIVDNSNQLAIFNNFFAHPDGMVSADMTIEVEGIVRTHGLTYLSERDMMLMTDVGAGSSPDDGAFVVIRDFMAAAADGTVDANEQIRIVGENTFLGNPVDIALDEGNNVVYIAERANGGGRVLGFDLPAMDSAGGDIAPIYNANYAGASAITFGNMEDEVEAVEGQIEKRIYVSSNTEGVIGSYNLLSDGSTSLTPFIVEGQDADGIHYDEDGDRIYQINRSQNVVNIYGGVDFALGNNLQPVTVATSTSDFSNGRGIAVSGTRVVVAQDATDSNSGNRFIVYNIDGDEINLTGSYDADINLWGIHATGETLFAIEDNSDRLAIYNDFFANTGTGTSASASISIADMVRTHGLTYVAERDMMLLTDVGSGAVADDGAFIVVRDFTAAAADGNISADEQIRIAGDNTLLGNPVDIAYCERDNQVYIAERANGGGRLLAFALPVPGTDGGNIAPAVNISFAGASSVAVGDDEDEVEGVANIAVNNLMSDQATISAVANTPLDWAVYPNPTIEQLQVQWNQENTTEELILRVINTAGQELSRQQVEAVEGINTYQINVANLPTGMYRLAVETTNGTVIKAFVKR